MTTPNTQNPDPFANTFAEIERELITRGAAATYFAFKLAEMPGIPRELKQEAQYFLWFGRCPANSEVAGSAS